jgi:hypothetical protein
MLNIRARRKRNAKLSPVNLHEPYGKSGPDAGKGH